MSTLEKHFFNNPTLLVNNSLRALTFINPSLGFDETNKIIYRRPDTFDSSAPKVSIISGGGSGHEPGFVGFVGKGMLTAGVAGTIFASPSAEQVRRAILGRVPTSKGVMVITFNYTGDVLNFGVATEKAKAGGIKTKFFAIGDDVGVGRAKGGKVGRRGIAGGILVLKIIGALAELGGSLEQIYTLARQVSSNLVSIGSSMEHVHVPGRGPLESLMPVGDIEVGMGIHNEPDRNFVDFKRDDQVVLLVNNLGGVSILELGGILTELVDQLKATYNINPVRVLSGTFLTSLNGLGFSVSLLRLEDTGLGESKSMLDLLDFPAEAYGWTAPIKKATWAARNQGTFENITDFTPQAAERGNITINLEKALAALKAGLQNVIAVEPEVTRFDTIVGDGDCGIGLRRGAEALLTELNSRSFPTDAVAFINMVTLVVEANMDGTSGAIYSIFLNALAAAVRRHDSSMSTSKEMDTETWSKALMTALDDLKNYTPAAAGDRTLMDALLPFVEILKAHSDVRLAAQKAKEGAEATKAMKASLGRSVYVDEKDEWKGKIPDAGAWGLQALLVGIADAI